MDTNKKTQRQTFKNFPSFEFVKIEESCELIWYGLFSFIQGMNVWVGFWKWINARFKVLNIKLNSDMERDFSADSIKMTENTWKAVVNIYFSIFQISKNE